MPVGFPAISDPRTNDVRALQLVIRNIRERIGAAESVLLAVQKQANQSSFSGGSIQAALSQLAALAARVTVLEAAATGVNDIRLVAATAISLDSPVVMTGDGQCAPVDVSNPDRIYAVIGVSTQAVEQGADVIVRVAGEYQLSTGAFTAGQPLFCGLDGITADPAYGIVVIPIGAATGAQTMWIQPGYPRLQLPSVYDATEQFLPVTWGLAQPAVELAWEFAAAYPGLMVKHSDGVLLTREIRAGDATVTVANGDGKDTDPTIQVNLAAPFTWTGNHLFAPVSGDTTVSAGNIVLSGDNQEVQIGAGVDLRLYHDGTDSIIENDTGNLVLRAGGELSFDEVATTTAAPSAGGAGALPATPAEYVTFLVNGVPRQFACY
jgi:hypothetical protein